MAYAYYKYQSTRIKNIGFYRYFHALDVQSYPYPPSGALEPYYSYHQQYRRTRSNVYNFNSTYSWYPTTHRHYPNKFHEHNLNRVWTLWYFRYDHTKKWHQMQNKITDFATYEDFLTLYSHISKPSQIKDGNDYSVFKKGITPMWEDYANCHGGRWIITIAKEDADELDSLWLKILFKLINGDFDESGQICGAVVNIRGNCNRISIWTSKAEDQWAVLDIGIKIKTTFDLNFTNMKYRVHKLTLLSKKSISIAS